MSDPYVVLGVPSNASMAQIKKAYRSMAREASSLPDQQREIRMNELNQAYDAIVAARSDLSGNVDGRGSYTPPRPDDGNRSGYPPEGEAYYAPAYHDVRRYIEADRIEDADMLLNGIPPASRTAEWHFLKGKILSRRGWLEEASSEFEIAYRSDPSVPEYRQAYEDLFRKRSGGYRSTGADRKRNDGCDACHICSGLLCADCCCESLGGDLIPCC